MPKKKSRRAKVIVKVKRPLRGASANAPSRRAKHPPIRHSNELQRPAEQLIVRETGDDSALPLQNPAVLSKDRPAVTSGDRRLAAPRYRTIDLFCGAGGLSAGFSRFFGHAFEPVWANDFNAFAARTFNENFSKVCSVGDINSYLSDPAVAIPEADVVIGGPPCQGFSLLNKNRAHDPRKELWRPYFEVVSRSNAKVFVMENVPQLLGSPEYADIVATAESLGFVVRSAVLNAADYGVPQLRKRAFIIGCRFADPRLVFPPKRTHYNPAKLPPLFGVAELPDLAPNAQPWRTVRNAIGDLGAPLGTEIRASPVPLDLHFGRTPTPKSLERYRAVPKEGMNRFDLLKARPDLTPKCWIRKKSGGTDLFGRMWWDRPSFTIRTEFFKPEKGRYLHPKQHRPITHREAARLQSFPDEFRFLGTKIEIAKQIGNAVPPALAAALADCVHALLIGQRDGVRQHVGDPKAPQRAASASR